MVQHEAGFAARPESRLRAKVGFPGSDARGTGAHGTRPRAHEGGWRVAEKWSARKTLAFIILVCGAFWAAVIAYLVI